MRTAPRPSPIALIDDAQEIRDAAMLSLKSLANFDSDSKTRITFKQSRAAWARLIKKIYDADPLCCPRCHKPMRVLAVITDRSQVLKILRHLIKTGKLSGGSRHQPARARHPVWIPPP